VCGTLFLSHVDHVPWCVGIHNLPLLLRALAQSTNYELSFPQSDFIHSIALYLAAFPQLVHTHTHSIVCDRFSNGKEDWAEQYCGLRLRFKVPGCCWSFSPVSFSNVKTHILTAIECLSCFLARFLVTTLIKHSFKLFKAWQIPLPRSNIQASLCYIWLASSFLMV